MSQRTITMTGRAPVRIEEFEWPLIAIATWDDSEAFNGQGGLRVRRHADGRVIVYRTGDGPMVRDGTGRARNLDAGVILPAPYDSTATASAIARVGGDQVPDDIVDACIADLPAEAI